MLFNVSDAQAVIAIIIINPKIDYTRKKNKRSCSLKIQVIMAESQAAVVLQFENSSNQRKEIL